MLLSESEDKEVLDPQSSNASKKLQLLPLEKQKELQLCGSYNPIACYSSSLNSLYPAIMINAELSKYYFKTVLGA